LTGNHRQYNAKLLLFGEYTVTKGSAALAIPLSLFSGTWAYPPSCETDKELLNYAEYLETLILPHSVHIDIPLFIKTIQKGLKFNSNIPIGYGLGSSGALVAAVADCFVSGLTHLPLNNVKDVLGVMESYFHGSSSGTDPLVSYLEKSVYIYSSVRSEILMDFSFPDSGYQLFLIDTGMKRQTSLLVEAFNNRYDNEPDYREKISKLSHLNQEAINYTLNKNWNNMNDEFSKISLLQFELFELMIPSDFKQIWSEGLEGALFKLKLCGAGGGGMVLGMTVNLEIMRLNYPTLKFIPL